MPRLSVFVAALGAALLAGVSAAAAATYHIDFDGSVFDVSANIEINGTNDVLGITGSVTGPNGAVISGLNPGDPGWISDNKFFPGSDPVVSNPGILFNAGAWIYN